MADIIASCSQLSQVPLSTYTDMGDGTYALVGDLGDRIDRLVGRMSNYDVLANGTLGALDEVVTLAAAGLGVAGIGITGTWSGTITVEGDIGDGVWRILPMIDSLTGTAIVSTTVKGGWHVGVAGFLNIRVHMFAYTSGEATIYIEGSSAPSGVFLSRSIPTGINNIGLVGSEGITISQTPSVTAGIYAANDAVGGLLTFANAGRYTGYGGVVKDVIILDDAGQDAEMELWLFNATFTAMADNAPWAPSEVDLRKIVAIISTAGGAWFAAGTPSAARVECNQRYDCVGTSLFGQLVTRGTPTFVASDDVTVIIGLLQD